MAEIIKELEINFPDYAMYFHEYGEAGSMNENDIENYESWCESMDEYQKEIGAKSWSLDITTGEHIVEDNCDYYPYIEPTFTASPDFGLPCDCYCGARVIFWK